MIVEYKGYQLVTIEPKLTERISGNTVLEYTGFAWNHEKQKELNLHGRNFEGLISDFIRKADEDS